MFMRAARTLSIPELLQVLSEKLDEEYFTMREMPLSFALSAGSLDPEVRSRCPVSYTCGVAKPDGEQLDQETRNPSVRYPKVTTLSTDQVTASKQIAIGKEAATSKRVASGDHFSHRSMRPLDRWGI